MYRYLQWFMSHVMLFSSDEYKPLGKIMWASIGYIYQKFTPNNMLTLSNISTWKCPLTIQYYIMYIYKSSKYITFRTHYTMSKWIHLSISIISIDKPQYLWLFLLVSMKIWQTNTSIQFIFLHYSVHEYYLTMQCII